MTNRKEKLLKGIVDLYVSTAVPVGSQALLDHCKLEVSSATIRNDLKALEDEGLVEQPHTSAGRIPTHEAYQYYVNTFCSPIVPQAVVDFVKEKPSTDLPTTIKSFAKMLAEELDQAIFVVFSKDQLYYTGLSHLFSHPEFADQGTVQNVSRLLDRFDEVAHHLFGLVEGKDMHMHIGPGNPFGESCTTMHIPFALAKNQQSMLGILGPMRMDYNQTIGSMRAAKTYLESLS